MRLWMLFSAKSATEYQSRLRLRRIQLEWFFDSTVWHSRVSSGVGQLLTTDEWRGRCRRHWLAGDGINSIKSALRAIMNVLYNLMTVFIRQLCTGLSCYERMCFWLTKCLALQRWCNTVIGTKYLWVKTWILFVRRFTLNSLLVSSWYGVRVTMESLRSPVDCASRFSPRTYVYWCRERTSWANAIAIYRLFRPLLLVVTCFCVTIILNTEYASPTYGLSTSFIHSTLAW